MTESAIEAVLASSDLFRGVEFARGQVCARRTVPGQLLEDRISGVPCAGSVARGTVDVYSVAEDGREVRISSLGRGEVFGVCNLFARSPLPTVLRARDAGLVALVAKDTLVAKMREDFGLAERLMTLYNEKIQFLIGRIDQLTSGTARGKLMGYLEAHTDAHGNVDLGASREDLARYLGVSRAALFRELAALRAEGVIRDEGERVVFVGSTPARR